MNTSEIVFVLILTVVLTVLFLFCGCSHQQFVRDTVDPVSGEKRHEVISNTNVMYFSKYKDMSSTYDNLQFKIGEAEKKPDIPPELLKAFLLLVAEPEEVGRSPCICVEELKP